MSHVCISRQRIQEMLLQKIMFTNINTYTYVLHTPLYIGIILHVIYKFHYRKFDYSFYVRTVEISGNTRVADRVVN